MITSNLVVFVVLSRMVKVRGACDKPFWIYEPSAAKMSRTAILENVQNKQKTKRITENRKDFFFFRKNNQRATAQSFFMTCNEHLVSSIVLE